MAMRWYAAKLLTYSTVGRVAQPKILTDEGVFLVRAKSPDDAFKKAMKLGRQTQMRFKNLKGQMVRWRFVGILDLWELFDSPPKDGSEVWYDLRERKNNLQYLRSLIPLKHKLKVSWLTSS